MSDTWVRDTGVVFALVFLIVGARGHGWALGLSAVCLVIVLLAPGLITPVAKLWFELTKVLARVMNPLFFSLVFFLVVAPIGDVRRVVSGDTRDLRKESSRPSAFVGEKRLFTKKLFDRPF